MRNEFKVQLSGRAGLVYSEGERSMTVDSELLAGSDFDIVVYMSRIRAWDQPYDAEPVTSDDLARIQRNIQVGLKGLRVDWA